jgi:hypothetical protein
MLNPVEPKDPQESKIYTMDWTNGLNSGATISASTWVVTGLTNAADTIVTGSLKTTIRLSGGVDGNDYTCTNTVTTSDGETLERSGVVQVRQS